MLSRSKQESRVSAQEPAFLPAHAPSYYAATANPAPDRPVLCGQTEADVCVLGGGFAGLSAALELAGRGYSVALLEAARIGWGASGRNGGQICTGYAPGMSAVARMVGVEDAKRLWAMGQEAIAMIAARVAQHRIRCDLAWGYLLAAVKARHLDEMRRELDLWVDRHGYDKAHIAGRDEVRAMVETEAYCGGLVDRGGGHLHSLNYCLGLADAAEAAGVRIFEGSKAVRLEPGPRPLARTAKGAVQARHIVLCGNAYMGNLVPEIRRKIMPVGTYVAATRPLGAERARRLIPSNFAVADANFVLNYFRLSADHRLLFGGRVSYTTAPPPNLRGAMRRSMLAVFPQLADAAFEYVWGGNVDITVERTPHLGRLPGNVWFAHGFSGLGVALTNIAGRVIAEAIAGTVERFDVFARLPHTTFVGGRVFRTPALALAMLWYRLRDLL
jgi:gamma-glutamylputrescine oxidase